MAYNGIDKELLQEAVDALSQHGSIMGAAKALGIPRSTFDNRVRRAREAGIGADEVELPQFPDEDIPVEKLIEMAERRFEARKASFDAHTWFEVKVNTDKPIGILWFGDPHVDDNGCNWAVLKRHCELCRDTEGLYGANIGDTTNNWAGRLQALYAKQDASVKTARKLAEWFMLDSGVPWIVWLLGNHDLWSDGAAILQQMAKRYKTAKIPLHEWEARFQLVFQGGARFRINAAHDFKGHSQWNPLHGPMKAGMMGQDADLLICGHKHNWGIYRFENAQRGLRQTFIRLRGYKYMDEYARQLGIVEQETGSGILTIFDPRNGGLLAFDDVETGVEYLNWLRR